MAVPRATPHPEGVTDQSPTMNTELLDPPRTELAAGAGTLEPSFLHVPLYERLANHLPTEQEREAAADFLHGVIAETSADADGLPDNPERSEERRVGKE